MNPLSIPVVLFAAVLAVFTVTFQAMRVCFERRDALLRDIQADPPMPKDYVRLIFHADWQSLWLGTCYLLFVVSVGIVLLPEFLPPRLASDWMLLTRFSCYGAATVPLFGLVANLAAGFDVKRTMAVLLAGAPEPPGVGEPGPRPAHDRRTSPPRRTTDKQ